MSQKQISLSKLKPDIQVTTARSGGPGGQHVNKVETKVILRFNVFDSELLTEFQRSVLKEKLASKLTKEGELIVE